MKITSLFLSLAFLVHVTSLKSAEIEYSLIEKEVMQVLDDFYTTFNAMDGEAHANVYHYPTFRLVKGNMIEWDTPDKIIESRKKNAWANFPKTGWVKTVWVERNIVQMSETVVHVATKFQRLRKDESVILTGESMHVLIKKDGRWGIKLRSSFL
jgi:hypothetical protein